MNDKVNLIENNLQSHKFELIIIKSRAIGWTILGSVSTKMICKYCGFSYSEYKIFNYIENLSAPKCISDEEKIIKDLLE